jgi:hypothetical protein
MHHMRYLLSDDPNIPHVLPPLARGTQDLVAVPRTDVLLPAVEVPEMHDRGFRVPSTTGGSDTGQFWVEGGDYHVNPGVPFAVSRKDVGPAGPYRLASESAPPGHPGTLSLNVAWRNTTASVVALRRILPARVIGQIAPPTNGDREGWLYVTDDTRYRTFAGAWIICDPSGRNARIATTEELATMFTSLNHPEGHIHTRLGPSGA